MECINILNLPIDCLFKIMKLSGCCLENNSDIRLVCKHFYEIYCSFTSCGIKFDSIAIRDDIIDSMAVSLRRPFKFTIVNHVNQASSKASKLNGIVERFAIHIRKLDFASYNPVSIADIEFVLRPMINLVELTFNELELDDNVELIENISIVLTRLERLFLKFYDNMDSESNGNLMDAVLSLKANSLKEFTVFNDNWKLDYTEFFQQHKTIKRVVLTGEMHYPDALKNLQLTHLCLYTDKKKFRRLAIDSQPMLKHLNFHLDDDPYISWCDDYTRSRVADEEFTIICRLSQLETLRLDIGKLSLDVVERIKNLNLLEELVLKVIGGDDSDCFILDAFEYHSKHMLEFVHYQKMFSKLIAIALPHLESFIWTVKNISFDDFFLTDNDVFVESYFTQINELGYIDVFGLMAASYPNLRKIIINMNKSTGNFSMHNVLKLFPHLETLTLDVSINYRDGPLLRHTNMKHLVINKMDFDQLMNVMMCMPNLESLEITDKRASIPFTNLTLQTIHEGIPKFLARLGLTFAILSNDFDDGAIKTLQEIIASLQSCSARLIGQCDFDKLSGAIDGSIERKMGEENAWLELFK